MTRRHLTEADNEVAEANSVVPMAILLEVLVKAVRMLIPTPLHSTIQMIFPHFQNSKMIAQSIDRRGTLYSRAHFISRSYFQPFSFFLSH